MSASPVVVPLHRAAFDDRAVGWALDDALGSTDPNVGAQRVRAWLSELDPADLDPSEQVQLIAELERLKSAAAAAQARMTVAFTSDRVADALEHFRAETAAETDGFASGARSGGRRARDETDAIATCVRSVGSEIALARRESPSRGDRFVGMARALVNEMPHTMAALEQGKVSEWGAIMMVRGTAVLTLEARAAVDATLGPQLEAMSPHQIDQATRREAAARDAAAVVHRREEAVKSRRVSVRPAPDGMAYLTLLTGLKEAVAAYASLHRHAQSVVAGTAFHVDGDGTGEPVQELPDGRSQGAVMADAAIARLTGRPTGAAVPVEVELVITDRALLGTGDPARSTDEPARIPGHGPVPAPIARAWLRDAGERSHTSTASGEMRGTGTRDATSTNAPGIHFEDKLASPAQGIGQVWLRRLYTSPDGRDLVAMDSRRRTFDGQLRRMLILRDDHCRTPYCDAPIAQHDHVRAHALGGITGYANGEGLCVRCNQVKEEPGWIHTVTSGDGNESPDRPGCRGTRQPAPHLSLKSRGTLPQDDSLDLAATPSPPHTVRITTPTGQVHYSTAPPLLGHGWSPPDDTALAGADKQTPAHPDTAMPNLAPRATARGA
ncbi:MAG: DUF222 domain-containing protein [Dermatophilus congolensis]|nr:DUF222 domain-containing protein [Dermatophilus congolensis]